jgi:Tfp pilus assembly protein PilN
MVNLIPKEEKKKMIADFRLRITVLFLFTFGFCVLVAIVALLPSYFISSTKYSLSQTKLETQKLDPSHMSEELAVIQDINKKLDLIENSEKNRFTPSVDVISAILLKKRPDIKITEISYQNDVQGKKIGVTGTAPSREVLLLFRLDLESSPAFKTVDLPISNFVKGSNIQFYLNLIPS